MATAKTGSRPPHITVSTPFSAPAWPPETGASMKPKPSLSASASSSRAMSAEAVVWSTRMALPDMPAKAPSGPWATERMSSSLPTHMNTISAPFAASAGVGAHWPP